MELRQFKETKNPVLMDIRKRDFLYWKNDITFSFPPF